MNVWALTLGSVSAISLLSLVGVLTFAASESFLRRVLLLFVGLAVGALLGDAFVHLIPEAQEHWGKGAVVPALVLSGMGFFFVVEKLFHWQHRHAHQDGEADYIHPVGPLNLAANSIHNFIDGMLIGASFLTSPAVGLATTLAIALHEIPHEFGNFAILVHAGYSRRRALLFNLLVSGTAIAGAVLSLLIGGSSARFSAWMLPFTAGGFIYIACCDLVPQLHQEARPLHSALQMAMIVLGAGLMFGMLLLAKS